MVNIRSVSNTRLSLSEEEFEYYMKLKQLFTEDAFRGLFQTDLSGIITGISPDTTKATPMPIIFFLLNVSFNQRMRQVASHLEKVQTLEERIKILEAKNP